MGRRWGKTVLGEVVGLTFAAMGGRVAWIVPSYKNSAPLWRMARRAVAPLITAGLVRVNETNRTITFEDSAGGGYLGIYTGEDNCDAMRGDDFDLCVLDEAAKISETAWTDAIYPTLADRDGKALLISTPRGRNWFWRWWMLGQNEAQADIRSFTAPSSDNPDPRIQGAAIKAKELVSERAYAQEWQAIFLEDAGGVFRNVRAAVGGKIVPHAQVGHRYIIGVDLAKQEDFTVCVVVDLDEQRVVSMDRFNKSDWPLVKARIYSLAKAWNDALIWMDSTGLGDPIYDDLRRVGVDPTRGQIGGSSLRINPFHLTAPTKEALIDNAVLLVENRQVTFPDLPALIAELEAYEYERLPSGHLRMTAPEGMHDDCVIAFALACWPLAHASARIPRATMELLVAKPPTGIGGVNIQKRIF
jgi:hypothetical protein